MIDFQDFGIEEVDRHLEYFRRCRQMPSNGSPTIALGYKDILSIQRGYAAELCWHKMIIDGEEYWSTPMGDWDAIDWRDVFKKHVPAGTTFNFIPEYLVNIWLRDLGNAIEVEEYRDNWDYILSNERMSKLEGGKLKKLRIARNGFEKNYDYRVEEISPEIFDELRQFQSGAEENLQARVEHVVEANEDNSIFHYALAHWNELKNLFGFAVRVDGQIAAYAVDEQITDTYSIGLFAKTDYGIRGLNQFAYWYDAEMQLKRGILTTNIMDDAGEENLRFFKEHLQPIAMLKKYVVTYESAED